MSENPRRHAGSAKLPVVEAPCDTSSGRQDRLGDPIQAFQIEEIDTPARRALYNNLNKDRDLALKVDEAIRQNRPDSWRGVQAREQTVKRAIWDVLQDVDQVERIFLIVKAQREY